MCTMYEIIEVLCEKRKTDTGENFTITDLCRELKINRSSLSELKQGRAKSLSADKVLKIADFFDVDPAYIMGETNIKKKSVTNSYRQTSDNDIKFALFNGADGVTDEMFDEVKRFAEMVKLREDAKKK